MEFQSKLHPSLPFYILGAGGMAASLIAVHLPETADEKLPDTVAQAEEFGKGQSYFYMPVCGRAKKNPLE